jgi:predicted peroxiredoxin
MIAEQAWRSGLLLSKCESSMSMLGYQEKSVQTALSLSGSNKLNRNQKSWRLQE